MAFTVPNRPDTTDADQAEPDKGDFQSLGYQKSGVLSGGVVTNTATNTVTATAVSGYLNGEYFSITADTVLSMAAPATGNAKFVLINVQKSGGVFSVYALQGTTGNNGESASNARFPDFDSTTDMLLAAVYYASGDTDINAAAIVDKRVVLLPQANPTVVTSIPGSAVGAIGEIRIDSNMTPGQGETRVYVKTDATTWTNLGTPQTGVSSEEVQDIVGAMFTTDATHSGISAVYDDAGGGVDLTGSTEWNLTVAGSTENIGGSDTVAINISSDAEVSLSHSNGTITINDEWPRIRTMTHNTLGNTKPAHYLYSDPWGQTTPGFGGPSGTGQFIYTRLQTGDVNPMVNNTHECGNYTYKWSVLWVHGPAYASSHAYTSDRNLKMNFGSTPGLSFVKGLMPVSFSWKDRAEETEWGFIAQDIEELCSQQDCDPLTLVDIEAESGDRYLNYAGIIAPLVNAVQELAARVEALENG